MKNDVKDIYREFALSLQNRGSGGMSNTIKFAENEKYIKEILNNYNVSEIAKKDAKKYM